MSTGQVCTVTMQLTLAAEASMVSRSFSSWTGFRAKRANFVEISLGKEGCNGYADTRAGADEEKGFV